MKSLIQFITASAFPKFSLFLEFIAHPYVGVAAIGTTVVASPVVDFVSAVVVLVIFFISDLASGIGASYCEWKSNPERKERWFFGRGEGFSSDKFKKMFVKLIIYLLAPLLIQKFQSVFMLKNLKYETLSAAEFSFATVLILLFIANEGFSIFHENLPKCGFNLWGIIKKMIGFYKDVKSEINN